VSRWGEVAYRAFFDLTSRAPTTETGILVTDVLEILPEEAPFPAWAAYVEGFRPARHDELPPDCPAGFSYRAPVIDMSRYLDYLLARYRGLGGQLVQRAVSDFTEAFTRWHEAFQAPAHAADADADAPRVLVNCAGLGARELAGDASVAAARGQVVRVAHTGFRQVLVENVKGRPTYIVPRVNDIVLGGTFDVGDESIAIDPATRDDILRRCASLALHSDARFAMSLAALAGGTIARDFAQQVAPEHRDTPAAMLSSEGVGLRPVSPRVRVEAERITHGRIVVHNYGHGGAGVTLSWGCAAEVVSLASAAATAA
jgi:D-amino-acid oxidase